MKKKFCTIFLVMFFLLTNIVKVNASYISEYGQTRENIRNYDVEIHVNEDASMDVIEKITVYANNNNIEHGIYRDFPTEYENKRVTFDVKQVLLDDEKVKYEISSVDRGARIKIGDADETVSKGIHTYTIKYTTERQMAFYDDYDELYWNIIGSGWNFEIENCHAKIYFPKGTKFIEDKLKTYNGRYGSKENNAYVYTNVLPYESAVEFQIYDTLDLYNAFTVSICVEKGAITEPDRMTQLKWFVEDNIISIIMAVFLIVLIIWQYFCWKKVGIDPKPNVIIPKYYPPEGMTPADVKYLSTMGGVNKILEASVINLAVKGYFKFTKKSEKSKKIVIEKNHDIEGLPELDDIEQSIYNKFRDKETLEYSSTFQSKLESLKTSMYKKLGEKYKDKLFFINGGKIAKSIISTIIVFIIAVIVGFFVNQFAAQMYLERIFLIFPIAMFLVFPVIMAMSIFKSGTKTLVKVFATLGFIIPFGLFGFLGLIGVITSMFENLFAGWVIFAIFLDQYLFIKLIKRYTEEGLRIKEDIEGFKMFINTAKDDDFEDKTPEMFDKYFPYAYVLGLENKWANKFEDVLKSAEYTPTWCSPYMYHNGVFDAVVFTNAFSSSFSSGMSSAATAPSSSGGSGGGGGFSGGGGGGRWPEEVGKTSKILRFMA